MHRVDYDSSDDEYADGFDDCFERPKKRYYDETTPSEPLDIERTVMNACVSGDLTTVQQYYSKENPTFQPNHVLVGNFTALMQAASYSKDHIVKYLLDIGANPNHICDGITALMCACASSSNQNFATLECVKCLLDKKALVNLGDRFGVTPLMKAIMCKKGDVVNLLLRHGVNLEMRNNMGRTAIFYAVEYKDPEILRSLIKANTKLDTVDRRGSTILMLAKNNECDEILEILKQVLPDLEEEEYVVSVSDGLNWCDMLPNTSVTRSRPAYSYEIPGLLRGMNCERLEPLISTSSIDLATFLTLDDEGLKTLGVDLPYERLKILVGLQSFHMHGWKTESVLGLTRNICKYFDPLKTLDILSCHMKNVTVLLCGLEYCAARIKEATVEVFPKDVTKDDNELIQEINKSLKELQFLKCYITKINQNNLPPADLILPNNPMSKKSFKKTKIIFCSVSIAMLTTVIVSVKYKISFDFLSLIPNKFLNKIL